MIVQTLDGIQRLEQGGDLNREIQEVEDVAGQEGVKVDDAALKEGMSEGLEELKQIVLNTDER
tara:strand:+ start:956 stop:1144 length:189 start_codon:yes stop_codon:yes gene_type:complete